jgi:hypothetical protein
MFGGEPSNVDKHIPEVYDFEKEVWSEMKSYDNLISRSLNFWASTTIYI